MTRYQLNLIPELQVVWRSVVNSINGVSHLVMPIRRPVCLKRHGAAWLWTTEACPFPSQNSSLSFHSARVRGNYLFGYKSMVCFGFGFGRRVLFFFLSELVRSYPEQRANAFSYSAGIGARIAISDRGSLNLRWTYLGSLGGEDSFEPIDAYLAEVGASYYF